MSSLRRRPSIQAREALLLALLAVFAWGGIAPIAAAHGNTKPTIVLVHGAWAGPAAWDQVVAELRNDGYRTVTPKLDLLSIDGDTAIVRSALDAIGGEKILVGHSYGGIVISNASAGRSDVSALVFTAAFLPDEGETIVSLETGFIPSAALANIVWTGEPFASLSFINPSTFRAVFAADVSAKRAGLLNSGQQATSPAVLVSPSGPVGWHTIPSWYAVSGKDLMIDPAEERWMAQRAGATIITFRNASHAGGFTVHAEEFAKLIKQAASATD